MEPHEAAFHLRQPGFFTLRVILLGNFCGFVAGMVAGGLNTTRNPLDLRHRCLKLARSSSA